MFLLQFARVNTVNTKNMARKHQIYCKCIVCDTFYELNEKKRAGKYCSAKCRNADYYRKRLKHGKITTQN